MEELAVTTLILVSQATLFFIAVSLALASLIMTVYLFRWLVGMFTSSDR